MAKSAARHGFFVPNHGTGFRPVYGRWYLIRCPCYLVGSTGLKDL